MSDAQHFHQIALLADQQAVALSDPDRQLPMLRQRLTQLHQAHAEQGLFDDPGRLALVDDPQLPLFQQLGVGQRHRP